MNSHNHTTTTYAHGAAAPHDTASIANGHAAAPAAPAAAADGDGSDGDGDGDAFIRSHLADVMASTSESYQLKMRLFNEIMKRKQSPQLSHTAVDYLQIIPQLLGAASFESMSSATAEFDDLLRECLHSVAQQVANLSAAASAPDATPFSPTAMLLPTCLSHILAWTVHVHPLVSEFGRSVWLLLHHTLEAPFSSFALQLVMRMLSESCASKHTETAAISLPLQRDGADSATPTAPAAHSQPGWQWRMNAAQNSLIELLAMVAPTLSRDDQMYLFRHFNLQLHASTPGSAFSVHALYASEQLPLVMLSALLLRVSIPQLHVDIQQLLYSHTFNFCVLELDHLRTRNKIDHTASMPVLAFLLEMLTAAFRGQPAAPVAPIAHALSLRGLTTMMALLMPVGSSIVHAPRLPPAVMCAMLEAMLRVVQQELVFRHMTHSQWSQWVSAMQHFCAAAPALRVVLGEVMVAVAPLRVPAEAQAGFFTRTLQATFEFLLNPAGAPSNSAELEGRAFDAFFRFTVGADGTWTSRFKDLIPISVRERLIAYVQVRSKTYQQLRPEERKRIAANLVQRQAVFAETGGLSGDQLATRLAAEAAQINDQCAQEQQQVDADAAATAHMRRALLAAYIPTVQVGMSDASRLVAPSQ